MSTQEVPNKPPEAILESDGMGRLMLAFSGRWITDTKLPPVDSLVVQLSDSGADELHFDVTAVEKWDSRFVAWIARVIEGAEALHVTVDVEGLPAGVRRLYRLSSSVPERDDDSQQHNRGGLLAKIGTGALVFVRQTGELLSFLGEVFLAFLRMLSGKARFRYSDLFLYIQQCGVDALPIVALISILVGLILAFIGAIQLSMFGAHIYIANLVGIAMVREMGAMMAAIIMAGRTGAAFSAQLGTMQVNEEIDAFKTFGIDPIEFLVLPRILALTLMLPLLCIFADLLGILGGLLVGSTLFDITPTLYVEQTLSSISLTDVAIGVVKSGVYAVLIGLAGCMKGIHCGRSAASVGEATTAAVVMSIVAIVIADAVMTLVINAIGI